MGIGIIRERKKDLLFLSGANDSKTNLWSNFYTAIEEIKEHAAKFSQYNRLQESITPLQLYETMKEETERYANKCFTGEEGRGRFVDMTTHFNLYINLKGIYKSKFQKIDDYLSYLKGFSEFHTIPINYKNDKYQKYLEEVYKYLKDFWIKSHPLNKHEHILETEDAQFETNWGTPALRGWYMTDENVRKLCKEKFHCQACKKEFINSTAFEFHKKSKKHIKTVNLLASSKVSNDAIIDAPVISEKMTV